MSAPTLHAHIAAVVYVDGTHTRVDFDQLQCVTHGFNFVREDGSFTFIAARLISQIESVPSPYATIKGSA